MKSDKKKRMAGEREDLLSPDRARLISPWLVLFFTP